MRALARSIRLPHATAMVVGTIIGASIFVQPSEVSRAAPTLGGMLLVWIAAGALTWFGASICAELSSAFPQTGGVYVFLRELFGPAAGFLWGWAMFWSMHSGIIAAIAVVFARYAATVVPAGDAGIRGISIGAIVALSAVNYAGVGLGSRLQAGLTLTKVLAIAVLLAVLFGAAASHVPAPSVGVDPRGFLRALIAGLFAFGGWHMVTYAAEETDDPRRTIPRALMLGVAIVVIVYLALNAAYLLVLPLDRVLASNRIAADAASAVAGPMAARAISVLVLISALGALSGIILAGPRVYYAMARDGLLFSWMAAVHPRVPHAVCRDCRPGCLVVRTRAHRNVPCVVHARRVHGVAILRRPRDWRHAHQKFAALHAGVSSVGLSGRSSAVCGSLPGHRAEPDRERAR